MRPAGLKAFERRTEARSGVHSHERRKDARLEPGQQRRLRTNKKAWAFFQAPSPSSRQTAIWWVVSAKREETKERRLKRLIDDSSAGRTVAPLTRPSPSA
jgi:uncharacterized protein YdeI (YjbR/CyaY-like superfamily)